jgi:hypothetical protein
MRVSWHFKVAWADAFLVRYRCHEGNASNTWRATKWHMTILAKAFMTAPKDLRHMRLAILTLVSCHCEQCRRGTQSILSILQPTTMDPRASCRWYSRASDLRSRGSADWSRLERCPTAVCFVGYEDTNAYTGSANSDALRDLRPARQRSGWVAP